MMTAHGPQTAFWLRRIVARAVDAALVLPIGFLLVQTAEAAEARPISPEVESLPAAVAARSARPSSGSRWCQRNRHSSPGGVNG